METETIETTDEVFESLNLCDGCLSVPLVVLALSIEVPLAGWSGLFDSLDIRQVTDHVGRPAVSASAARRLLNTVRRWDELAVEDRARLFEKLKVGYPVAVGVPVVEGASPYESLVAAGGVTTPQQEFGGGRPRPDFLREELAAGQRADDEKKRLAAERAKQRLADQARDKLR